MHRTEPLAKPAGPVWEIRSLGKAAKTIMLLCTSTEGRFSQRVLSEGVPYPRNSKLTGQMSFMIHSSGWYTAKQLLITIIASLQDSLTNSFHKRKVWLRYSGWHFAPGVNTLSLTGRVYDLHLSFLICKVTMTPTQLLPRVLELIEFIERHNCSPVWKTIKCQPRGHSISCHLN